MYLSAADEGKPVVDANGRDLGVITRVTNGSAFAQPVADLGASVRSALGWGGDHHDAYRLDSNRVVSITGSAVRVAVQERGPRTDADDTGRVPSLRNENDTVVLAAYAVLRDERSVGSKDVRRVARPGQETFVYRIDPVRTGPSAQAMDSGEIPDDTVVRWRADRALLERELHRRGYHDPPTDSVIPTTTGTDEGR